MVFSDLSWKEEDIQFPGDDGEEVPPVPIPNTEVKLFSADGTWDASPWESRSSPGFFEKPLRSSIAQR